MTWFSYFYQSGMSGQGNIRLPNGEDLPLPDSRAWGGRSANIDVDFAMSSGPRLIRIHYRVVISAFSTRNGTLPPNSVLMTLIEGFLRNQGISRTVGRSAVWILPRAAAGTASVAVAAGSSATRATTLGTDNYIRCIDGDRAFTYIVIC